MNQTWRKVLVTSLVAGMLVMLVSGFAGAATRGYGGLRNAVAQALGVENDVVVQARQEGKTLREVLIEKGIDPEEFVQEQYAARKAVIDQLEAEGTMTAEQAALCLENLEANLNTRLDSNQACSCLGQGQGRGCGGQGRGVGGMMRGRFGWGK